VPEIAIIYAANLEKMSKDFYIAPIPKIIFFCLSNRKHLDCILLHQH